MAFERTITSNGKRYRQLVRSVWDPEKKQSRIHVIKHLGKLEKIGDVEKLVPSQLRIDTIDKAYPVGKLAIFWATAEEFGIRQSISETIGDNGNTSTALALLAINQVMGRRSLTKLGKWIADTPIPRWINEDPQKFTKDYFLSALDRISGTVGETNLSYTSSIQKKLVETWRKIIPREKGRSFFYQDITRIGWNGGETWWAEKGYGEQIGRLHVGFGLLVSKENHMPILGYPVKGSMTDKTTVKESVVNLRRVNNADAIVVWDRGFVSRQNILYARQQGFHVLSGGVRTSNEVVGLIISYQDAEIEKRENILKMSKSHIVYFKENISQLYGNKCKIVILLDPERRNRTRIERDLLIQELETATSKQRINELKNKLDSIIKPAIGRKGYVIDAAEEERIRKLDGRFLLFCTDLRISGREIIRTYFQKDVVEKAFRTLKGNADLSPINYQISNRVDAYLSVVNFIAYELMAAIHWKIKNYGIDASYESLIEEASRICEVEFTSKGNKIHDWTHISAEAEKIIKPFNIMPLKT